MPLSPTFRLICSLTVAAALLAGVHAFAQTAAPTPPNGGFKQGIHISGWWKIDVRNPDGTLQKHIEFENTLTPGGINFLTYVLEGNYASGGIAITASAGAGVGPCGTTCYILPAFLGSANCTAAKGCFANVLTTVGNSIQLDGNMTAQQTGDITTVGTQIQQCPPTITPKDCVFNVSNGGLVPFTQQTLDTPFHVTAGQIVQFHVTLSFS